MAGETLSWCTAHSRWHSDDRGFFCLAKGEGWAATPVASRAGHAAAAGYDLSQLRAAFVSAEALQASGFTAAELKAVGFSTAELVAAGGDLRAWGLPIANAKAGGLAMVPELFGSGYTACAEYKGLGFTFDQLCSTGRPDGKPFSSRELVPLVVGWRRDESYVADMRNAHSRWASLSF